LIGSTLRQTEREGEERERERERQRERDTWKSCVGLLVGSQVDLGFSWDLKGPLKA